MAFCSRASKSDKFIDLMIKHVWSSAVVNRHVGLLHEQVGYERSVSERARQALIKCKEKASLRLRYTPDFLLVHENRHSSMRVLLLEYKVTTTPRYTLGDEQWNSGQIEADAWDQYMDLQNSGSPVALLIYCPYHERPILCDFPDPSWLTLERTPVKTTETGSRTQYCNIDLTKMRSLEKFMEETYGIGSERMMEMLGPVLLGCREDESLQVEHAPKSPYRTISTGVNWSFDYIFACQRARSFQNHSSIRAFGTR